MNVRFLIVLVGLLLLMTGFFTYLHQQQPEYVVSVLYTGNIVMFGIAMSSILIVQKQMRDKPQAFVRGVSGASFLKLILCVGGVLGYVMIDRKHVHKPTLFMLFGIYAVYTVVETIMLARMARKF